jgi:PAS domain-containing protein
VRQAAQRGLQRAQERAGDLVKSAMDPIITIDELQHIVTFNTAAEETFGWTRDQVIGKPVDMLIPERFRSRHREHIEQFAGRHDFAANGWTGGARGPSRQRRGIPDRSLDLPVPRRR